MNEQQYLDNARLAFERGNYTKALSLVNQAIKRYPKSSQLFNASGVVKVAIKDYAGAVLDYDKAIKLDPNFALPYNYRGSAKANLGRYADAIVDYNKAIELNTDFVLAFYNRGSANYNLGNYADAVVDYDKAIGLDPDFALAYSNRGTLKGILKDYRGAISDYDKAIGLDPNSYVAYTNKGIVKNDLGKHSEAISDYDKAIELNSNYSEAFYNRGNSKNSLRDYSGAIKDYDIAIGLNPNYSEAFNNRGIMKVKLQDYSGAIKDYDIAIGLNPNYAEAFNNRGNAKKQTRDNIGARQDYQTSFRLSFEKPKNQFPNLLLKFRPINLNTIKALSHGLLYFNHPCHFNDPLDGNFLKSKTDKNPPLDQALNGIKVACFFSIETQDYFEQGFLTNEYLLWSHYADSHKGICLVYARKDAADETKPIPYRLDKVKYEKELKEVDTSSINGILQTGYFNKHESWKYEQEYRILVQEEEEGKNPTDGKLVSVDDLGLCLRAVVFGLECKEDDKQLVREISSVRYGKDIAFYQVQKEGKGNHYSLVKKKA